jgi:large conductance mechanosensitive channel
VSFVIVAAVIYFFVVLPINKPMDRYKTQESAGPPQRECPECLSKIPQAARRCAFCTAEVGTVRSASTQSAAGRRPVGHSKTALAA